MLRPPFAGHRRYSITHRAVQRLRELVLGRDEEDDESLRDRLDEALASAEDSGKAIRTLDAMLGEPQTLVPVDAFGDMLYAIIKEETVVTVLPRGHGEEILQRGQAMEQRVAAGHATMRQPERDEARRRWRKEAPAPVVIERIVRNGDGPNEPRKGNGNGNGAGAAPSNGSNGNGGALRGPELASPTVVEMPERPQVSGPVAEALRGALDRGRRRAAVLALADALKERGSDEPLLPVWNALAGEGAPAAMTVGDLLEAVRQVQAE